jgi:hypothetical protein
MDHVLVQARGEGLEWRDGPATRTAAAFYAARGGAGDGRVEALLDPGVVFPAIRLQRWLQSAAAQTERAGLSTGPSPSRLIRKDYSRLPMNCSRNMNRLMKSR